MGSNSTAQRTCSNTSTGIVCSHTFLTLHEFSWGSLYKLLPFVQGAIWLGLGVKRCHWPMCQPKCGVRVRVSPNDVKRCHWPMCQPKCGVRVRVSPNDVKRSHWPMCQPKCGVVGWRRLRPEHGRRVHAFAGKCAVTIQLEHAHV
jgi:hypothetical protein